MRTDKTATGRELHRFWEEMVAKGQLFTSYTDEPEIDVDGRFALELDTEYDLDTLGNLANGSSGIDIGDAYREWVEERRLADPRRRSPRYPHKYADDLLRILAGATGLHITNVQSGWMRDHVADLLGIPRVYADAAFADYYLEHEQELVQAALDSLLGDVG